MEPLRASGDFFFLSFFGFSHLVKIIFTLIATEALRRVPPPVSPQGRSIGPVEFGPAGTHVRTQLLPAASDSTVRLCGASSSLPTPQEIMPIVS